MSTRTPAAFLAAVLSLLGVGLVPTPAQAAGGRCAEGTGVTVVVDPGPLGGGVRIGCAPGGADQPGSQVVPAAGFPLTYVSGAPFVCRISGSPGADVEDCSGTPPADAYWGLFWSDGDPATWTYASVGITGLEVPEGGSIGWRWQDGGARDLPAAAPNADPPIEEPSPEPSPEPSTPPSTPPDDPDEPSDGPSREPRDQPRGEVRGGAGPTTGPTATSSGSASAGTGGPSASASAGGRDGAASPSGPRTRGPARRTAEDRAADRREKERETPAAVADGEDPSAGDASVRALEPVAGEASGTASSPVAPWLAGAVLLALGAGAAVLSRRRRTGT